MLQSFDVDLCFRISRYTSDFVTFQAFAARNTKTGCSGFAAQELASLIQSAESEFGLPAGFLKRIVDRV